MLSNKETKPNQTKKKKKKNCKNLKKAYKMTYAWTQELQLSIKLQTEKDKPMMAYMVGWLVGFTRINTLGSFNAELGHFDKRFHVSRFSYLQNMPRYSFCQHTVKIKLKIVSILNYSVQHK